MTIYSSNIDILIKASIIFKTISDVPIYLNNEATPVGTAINKKADIINEITIVKPIITSLLFSPNLSLIQSSKADGSVSSKNEAE